VKRVKWGRKGAGKREMKEGSGDGRKGWSREALPQTKIYHYSTMYNALPAEL